MNRTRSKGRIRLQKERRFVIRRGSAKNRVAVGEATEARDDVAVLLCSFAAPSNDIAIGKFFKEANTGILVHQVFAMHHWHEEKPSL